MGYSGNSVRIRGASVCTVTMLAFEWQGHVSCLEGKACGERWGYPLRGFCVSWARYRWRKLNKPVTIIIQLSRPVNEVCLAETGFGCRPRHPGRHCGISHPLSSVGSVKTSDQWSRVADSRHTQMSPPDGLSSRSDRVSRGGDRTWYRITNADVCGTSRVQEGSEVSEI